MGDETAPTLVTKIEFDVGKEEESRKGQMLRQELLTDAPDAQCPSDADGRCTLDGASGCFSCEQYTLETQTLAGDAGPGVKYSFVKQKDTYLFELTDTGKVLQEAYDRDVYGNLTQEFKYGLVKGDDRSAGQDEVLTYTEYAYNLDNWIVDRAKHIRKTDLAGNTVAEQKLYYDGLAWTGLTHGQMDKGNLTRKEERIGPNGSGGHPCPDEPAVRCIDTLRNRYDGYGNVTGIMDAEGDPSQLTKGHHRTLIFDSAFNAFPVEEHIQLEAGRELVARAGYDYGLGFLTEYRDFNNQVTRFIPDALGRLSKIVKPGDTEPLPTVQYIYNLANPISYIEANQREQSGRPGTVDNRMYFDGLGRKLQTKLRAENGKFVVQDGARFNQRTQVQEKYLSYFAAENTFEYRAVETDQPKTTLAYDALDREIQKTQPDSRFSQTVYRPLEKTVSDEENTDPESEHADQPKTFTSDGLNRLVQVDERNGGEVYTTTYQYDPLNNLTQIMDAQSNPTSFIYDGLSRKVEANEPDRGRTLFTYFDTGMLKESTDAEGQKIQYTYDAANRIKTETWVPREGPPLRHAAFYYDWERPAGLPAEHPAINGTLGRLVYVEDLSGLSVFSYDARDRTVVNTRKINTTGVFYTTQFSYDAADRLNQLTYPDRSYITHRYNRRGLLEAILREAIPNLVPQNLVPQITYRASGQTESVQYGNGVLTRFEYDPRLRLDVLKTTSPTETPSLLQDLKYRYDHVSNVQSIADRRTGIPPERNLTECFRYDDLYRLTHVDGRCGEAAYFIDFTYDKIGNMTSRISDLAEMHVGPMLYGENGAGPHAVTTAGDRRFRYDANGNMREETGVASYRWDAKDRLVQVVQSGGPTTDFRYDYAGARVSKQTEEETVFYINNYAEVRNGQLIKYIFAGTRRLAEVIAGGQVLFNHSDHLGSSNIVTDGDGRSTGWIEYYPFGQERARHGSTHLPYTYTDKEKDQSTGLHYFEARYYANELGRFIAVDPIRIIPSRLGDPQLANPYSYARNNPLRYVDPTGEDPQERQQNQGVLSPSSEIVRKGQQLTADAPKWGWQPGPKAAEIAKRLNVPSDPGGFAFGVQGGECLYCERGPIFNTPNKGILGESLGVGAYVHEVGTTALSKLLGIDPSSKAGWVVTLAYEAIAPIVAIYDATNGQVLSRGLGAGPDKLPRGVQLGADLAERTKQLGADLVDRGKQWGDRLLKSAIEWEAKHPLPLRRFGVSGG